MSAYDGVGRGGLIVRLTEAETKVSELRAGMQRILDIATGNELEDDDEPDEDEMLEALSHIHAVAFACIWKKP